MERALQGPARRPRSVATNDNDFMVTREWKRHSLIVRALRNGSRTLDRETVAAWLLVGSPKKHTSPIRLATATSYRGAKSSGPANQRPRWGPSRRYEFPGSEYLTLVFLLALLKLVSQVCKKREWRHDDTGASIFFLFA